MSSTSQSEESGTPGTDYERKYSWIVRVVREFGLPVAILAVFTWWLAIRVEQRFERLEDDIKLHQRFLQQICVNTAKEQDKYQCWGIY
jgi:hypothetical protein